VASKISLGDPLPGLGDTYDSSGFMRRGPTHQGAGVRSDLRLSQDPQ
jgi:hypothetical protein